MTDNAFETERVETLAGTYAVKLYQDLEPSLHPLEDDSEVFGALVEYSGYGGRWDKATDTLDSAGRSGEVLRQILAEHDDPQEVGRRYTKWQALAGSPWVLAMEGRSTVYRDYYRVALLADSRDLPQVENSIRAVLDYYHKYASGEVYGFVTVAPNGEQIESDWGFYDTNDALAEGRSVAEHDASQRVEQASRVGAGIVGLV